MKHFQLGDSWESELDYGHLSTYLINILGTCSVLCIENLTVNKTAKVPTLKDLVV